MTLVPLLLAALLAAPPVAAAKAATAPASKALVDRFMAAVEAELRTPAGRAEALRQAGPGAAILGRAQACVGPQVLASGTPLLRRAAAQFGQDKLQKLVDFYGSPDFPRYKALSSRDRTGHRLSPAEQADERRILARYPIKEFRVKAEGVMRQALAEPKVIEAIAACAARSRAAR